jgi:deazaflavin-dependent oxidoreductase (nitroreductase family)
MFYNSLLRRLGHQPWFAALGRRLVPIDRWLLKRSGGRFAITGQHELPSLLLTTVGRRSGQPRTTPLLYVTVDDGYVVVASNWGQAHHPAWSGNLLAQPEATVTIGSREIPVRGELATGTERDRIWRIVEAVWPAYNTYADRSGRDIRVFRLVPAVSPPVSN